MTVRKLRAALTAILLGTATATGAALILTAPAAALTVSARTPIGQSFIGAPESRDCALQAAACRYNPHRESAGRRVSGSVQPDLSAIDAAAESGVVCWQ